MNMVRVPIFMSDLQAGTDVAISKVVRDIDDVMEEFEIWTAKLARQ